MSLIEVFNLSIYGIQVNKLSRTAAYQAAAMFTQETYNTEGRNFVGTLDDIIATTPDGSTYRYCSANFFNSSNVNYLNVTDLNDPDVGDKIHKSLFYDENSEFYKLAENSLTHKDSQFYPYTNFKLLGIGTLNGGSKISVPELDFGSDSVTVQKNQDFTQVNTYIENKYTPANLGIPFIDKNVATNMFQYSLTKLLSGCDPDNIWHTSDSVLSKTTGEHSVTTEDGTVINEELDSIANASVYYHGFKCYVSGSIQTTGASGVINTCAKITNIDYTTYDLTKASKTDASDNNLPGRKEFTADTGYKVRDEDTSFRSSSSKAPGIHSASKSGTSGIGWSSSDRKEYFYTGAIKFSDENLDNALVTVATIKYAVPMRYVGITPLAQVFNYVLGKSVAGLGTDGNGTEATSGAQYNYLSDEARLDMNQVGSLFGGSDFKGDGELSAYYKSDEVQFMLID